MTGDDYKQELQQAKRRTGGHRDVEESSHVEIKDGSCFGETLTEREIGQGH